MDKKGLIILIVLFLTGISGISSAVDLGIITGSKQGTSFQFGQDMMKMAKQYGFDILVYDSRGSVDNVYAVYNRPEIQMGIVQSDVLAFVLKVKTSYALRRIAKKIRMIFPLYDEEVHLLCGNKIHSFYDLKGKTVAVGKEGGGTYVTSRLLLEVSGIKPKKILNIGTGKALSELKKGYIDAMFYVSGFPVKLFSDNVVSGEGLHLVSITDKRITKFYPIAHIPSRTYPWQSEAVNTVSVKAVLISFDFRQNNCAHIGKFAGLVYSNMDFLRQNGHPKWKSVDLDSPFKEWKQYDCVKKYIHADLRKENSIENNPLFKAIKKMLSS